MTKRVIRSMAATVGLVTGLAFGLVVLAAPASALPGLQRVQVMTVTDSSATKSAQAACPSGKVVVGGGARIRNGFGRVVIDRMVPGSAAYRAVAHEDEDGYSGSWDMQVVAICAFAPAGLEYVASATPLDSTSFKAKTAQCSSGKVVIGTGGEITGSGTGASIVVEDITPPVRAPFNTLLITGFEDDDGFSGNWGVRAHAVCANPIPGYEIAERFALSGSATTTVEAFCPAGKRVHGVGVLISGDALSDGNVVIDDFWPDTALDRTRLTGIENQDGTTVDWSIRGIAICIP